MIRSTSPDAYIIFFPYTSPKTKMGVPYSSANLKTETIFVRTDLMSVSTTKSKGSAGSWTCTLSPRVNYKSLIQAGTWCMICMSDDDLTLTEQPTLNNALNNGLKMLGVVRSVRAIESIDAATGTRNLRYEISGDDFHSVMDAQAYINPELRPHGDKDSSALIDAFVYFDKTLEDELTPAGMSQLLIETLLGKKDGLSQGLSGAGGRAGGVYGVPPAVATRLQGNPATGNLFVNLLHLALDKNLIGQITFQPQLASMFTLWSMLESYCNKVVNEIYTDLLPMKIGGVTRLMPTFVLRPIPFTSPAYSGAKPFLRIKDAVGKKSDSTNFFYTSRFIPEDEIMGMNYGKSDAERFNFFFVANNFANDHQLSGYAMAQLLGEDTNDQNPLGDANSIARHGLRPYLSSSNYMQLDDEAFVTINKLARDMWHEAYLYENGQVMLVGTKDHIPVGTNIQFTDRKWIAHVEAVSHSYTVNPNGVKTFRTSVSFVRLQKTDGTPIDFAADAKDSKSYQQNITSNKGDKQ